LDLNESELPEGREKKKEKETYPVTLPTLRPPKTNATARERSSNGMDLHIHLKIYKVIEVPSIKSNE